MDVLAVNRRGYRYREFSGSAHVKIMRVGDGVRGATRWRGRIVSTCGVRKAKARQGARRSAYVVVRRLQVRFLYFLLLDWSQKR